MSDTVAIVLAMPLVEVLDSDVVELGDVIVSGTVTLHHVRLVH